MTTEELKAMIEKRNAEVRRDHERRYGKALPQEAEDARFQRIMDDERCWEKM